MNKLSDSWASLPTVLAGHRVIEDATYDKPMVVGAQVRSCQACGFSPISGRVYCVDCGPDPPLSDDETPTIDGSLGPQSAAADGPFCSVDKEA